MPASPKIQSWTIIRLLLLAFCVAGMMGAGCDPFAGCWPTPTQYGFDDDDPGTGDNNDDDGGQNPPPATDGTVANVVFAPSGGSFGDSVDVFLTSPTPFAAIRYTTDGTDPTTTAGTVYTGVPVRLTATTTLKAIAYRTGWTSSAVTQATYTKVDPATIVAQPLFNPDGGSYPTPVNVQITCPTADATIRYTTDGTDPSQSNGTVIASGGTVIITDVKSLAAIAYKTGMIDSPLRRATYRTLDLVLIPAGSFQMGDASNEGEPTERPVHTVTLTKSFYIGRYEVTQAEWQAVMGSNPAYFTGDGQRPVEQVSWDECQAFLSTLRDRVGLPVRLPTEAEWEYACRAGSTTDFYYGNDASVFGDYAWYLDNSSVSTHPVGQKLPNAWGLYDMHGNVWEWCSDWYAPFTEGPVTNPTGPATGTDRILRGGAFHSPSNYSRCSARGYITPDNRWNSFGFRIALDAE